MNPEDNNMDRGNHIDPEEGEYFQPRSRRTPPNGTRSGPLPDEWTSRDTSSRSNCTSRPSTAPDDQHNYENRIVRRTKPHGSPGSSSQGSSDNSDNDNDDQPRMDDDQSRMEEEALSRFVSQLSLNCLSIVSQLPGRNSLPPIPGQARPWRRMPRDAAFHTRGRGQSVDPVRFRTDMEGKISRSRSPVRSRSLEGLSERLSGRHTKPFQGWSTGVGMDEGYPYADTTERMSNRRSYAEDLTHIPTSDHRRMLNHSSFGHNHAHRSTSSHPHSRLNYGPSTSEVPGDVEMLTTRDAYDVGMPSSNQNAYESDIRNEGPFFTPSRGDIILLQPPQRGRKHNHRNFTPSLVRTFNDRFGFSNGDLIVRIGTYARRRHMGEVLYIPYRIVKLYRRQDGVWKFLGDSHCHEDLGLKRRRSGRDTPPFRGRSGQDRTIEPNWGDFIIRQDIISQGEQTQRSIEDMLLGLGLSREVTMPVIEWWTPNLPEEVHRVYPHNTILLRPYVRNPNFSQARQEWFRTPDVIRWDYTTDGGGQQGTIVKVWPESIIHYEPLPHYSEPLEVVGPFRVGVIALNPPGSEVEAETVAWPLTSTYFLNVRDKSLFDYLSDEETEALMTEPWGSIEIYIYSAGVQPGWVYWGSSRHICDTPLVVPASFDHCIGSFK